MKKKKTSIKSMRDVSLTVLANILLLLYKIHCHFSSIFSSYHSLFLPEKKTIWFCSSIQLREKKTNLPQNNLETVRLSWLNQLSRRGNDLYTLINIHIFMIMIIIIHQRFPSLEMIHEFCIASSKHSLLPLW